jgi:hypothetical protein
LPGKLGPYAAVFVFAVGIFVSNFLLNTLMMKKPFVGTPVTYADYFQGGLSTHLTGILGGIIWGVGMSFNIIASGRIHLARIPHRALRHIQTDCRHVRMFPGGTSADHPGAHFVIISDCGIISGRIANSSKCHTLSATYL